LQFFFCADKKINPVQFFLSSSTFSLCLVGCPAFRKKMAERRTEVDVMVTILINFQKLAFFHKNQWYDPFSASEAGFSKLKVSKLHSRNYKS
jgi:hypothetical protein